MHKKLIKSDQINITELSNEKIIDTLEANLKKQLNLMRTCRVDEAVDITQKNTELIELLSKMNIVDNEEFQIRKRYIMSLIKQVSLAAAAKQQAVSSEIKKLSRGKKSLAAYKNSEYSQHSNLL